MRGKCAEPGSFFHGHPHFTPIELVFSAIFLAVSANFRGNCVETSLKLHGNCMETAKNWSEYRVRDRLFYKTPHLLNNNIPIYGRKTSRTQSPNKKFPRF
jgi:hypothetical protein